VTSRQQSAATRKPSKLPPSPLDGFLALPPITFGRCDSDVVLKSMAKTGIIVLAVVISADAAHAHTTRKPLRDDGVPVVRMSAEHVRWSIGAGDSAELPYVPFPEDLVARALDGRTVDWRGTAAVTSVKDQGSHGYCGTFGRVESAEGQYGVRSGYGARNFSVQQLIDCVGWDLDQTPSFETVGFMDYEDYPYNLTAYPDSDPPIPGNPCRLDESKIIPGVSRGITPQSQRQRARRLSPLACSLGVPCRQESTLTYSVLVTTITLSALTPAPSSTEPTSTTPCCS